MRDGVLEDYHRAPWAHPFPYRCLVTRVEMTGYADGLHGWVAMPVPSHPGDSQVPWETITIGRREVALPIGAALCATWREAMRYARGVEMPRDIADLPEYRDWCGYA